jgi:uncharacterized protein (DUF305 family)
MLARATARASAGHAETLGVDPWDNGRVMALVTEPQHDAPQPPELGEPTPGEGGGPWWHSRWRLAVLAVALMFLAGSAVYTWVTVQSQPPAEGSVDVGFLQDMRLHHDQAVQMAWIYTRKDPAGQDRLLTQIAGEILFGQQFEAGVMAQQLRSWERSEANDTGISMAWMGMPVPSDRMIGMASQAELEELAVTDGPSADRLFARLMLGHHEGGVHMAEDAALRAETDEVRVLARSMWMAQIDEITELRRILTRLESA